MNTIRKDVLTFMPLNCAWAEELMENVQKTCLSKSPLRGWIPMKIHIVDNPDLEEAFEDRKEAFRKMGRTEEELKEQFCFMAESWKSVVSMCKYGVRCQEKKTNILGDTRAGLHLNRHYDMLLKFMTFRNFITARCVVVFKVVPGRVKRVMPRFKGRTLLHPSKHYDAHVSVIDPDPNVSVCEGLANNFMYIYQLDPETMVPLPFPRQAVPYAVIQLRQPYRVTVHRPFTSFRDKFLAQMRNRDGHRSLSVRRTFSGSDRKDRNYKSIHKGEHRKRGRDYSDASESDDNSYKIRERNKMPKLTPVPKRSHTPEGKKSKTPSRKRSSTPLRKRSNTPASRTSDKEQSTIIADDFEAGQSCIKTKLQKIEEEIKLRQSKLTELRHLKNTQESDIGNSKLKTEKIDSECHIEEHPEHVLSQTLATIGNDSFAPRISCVYSAADIGDVDTKESLAIREALSSGASTPTQDEPGDQQLSQLTVVDNDLNNGKYVVVNGTSTTNLVCVPETFEKIKGDIDKQNGDDNSMIKAKNTETFNDKSNKLQGGENEIHMVEELMKTIDSKIESTDPKSTNDEKQDDRHMKLVHKNSGTDNLDKKDNSMTSDKHVSTVLSHQEADNNINSNQLADKSADIKTLLREAIYKMDPSDLYELLTEKLGDDDDIEVNNECKNLQVVVNMTDVVVEPVDDGNDGMVLDLSCKTKMDCDKITKNPEQSGHNTVALHDQITTSVENTSCNAEQHNIYSTEDININSVKREIDFMALDNLDILASVASELQAAKEGVRGGTRSDSNVEKLTSLLLPKFDISVEKQFQHSIAIDNCAIKDIKSEKMNDEQEYIFDAEKFNLDLKDGKSKQPNAVLPRHSTGIKQNKPPEQCVKNCSVEIDHIYTKSVQANQASCKRRISDKKRDNSSESTKPALNTSVISPIIASTKRKTANSLAAAFAATEQSPSKVKNISTKASKQSQKRSVKQNDRTKNTMDIVTQISQLENCNEQKNDTVNESAKQSPKVSNETNPNLSISKLSTDSKFNCRENLFEKFATTDSLEKGADKQNDNITCEKDVTSMTTDVDYLTSIKQKSVPKTINIKQEPVESNPPSANVGDQPIENNSVKQKPTSSENCLGISANSMSLENIKVKQEPVDSDLSSVYVGDQLIENNTVKQNQSEKNSANSAKSVSLNNKTIKQDPVESDSCSANVSDQSVEANSVQQTPTLSGNILANSAKYVSLTNKNIKQEPFISDSSSENVGDKSVKNNSVRQNPTPSELYLVNCAKSVTPTPQSQTMKKEPLNQEYFRKSLSDKPIVQAILKKKRAESSIKTTSSLFDQSIVELMDKKVTESMKQADLNLITMSVVKKEPVSPKETATEKLPLNDVPDKSDTITSSLNENSKTPTENASNDTKTTKEEISQNHTLPVVIKEEPLSPTLDISTKMPPYESAHEAKNSHDKQTLKKKSDQSSATGKTRYQSQSNDNVNPVSDIDKTLKDLEQVIGIFSQRVHKNDEVVLDVYNKSATTGDDSANFASKNGAIKQNEQIIRPETKCNVVVSMENSVGCDKNKKIIKDYNIDGLTMTLNEQNDSNKIEYIKQKDETVNSGKQCSFNDDTKQSTISIKEQTLPLQNNKNASATVTIGSKKAKNDDVLSSQYMPIEVITGNIPPKKSVFTNKVSQTLCISSSDQLPDKPQSNNPKSVVPHLITNRDKNSKVMSDGRSISNNTRTQHRDKGDDTKRANRVLNAAYKESSSSDTTLKIKKEPVTEDEYYGLSQSHSAHKTKPKSKVSKKKTENIIVNLNKRSGKRNVSESTQSSPSPSRPTRTKGLEKYQHESNVLNTSKIKKGNIRSTLSPLDAIRTHYASSKYNDEQYKKRHDTYSESLISRKRGGEFSCKRVQRSRSSSLESSFSSSIESPSRDFSKRRLKLPVNFETNPRFETSPLKYTIADDRSLYVKSKWDSSDTKEGHSNNFSSSNKIQDYNRGYSHTSGSKQRQGYDRIENLTSVSSPRNAKSRFTTDNQRFSSSNNGSNLIKQYPDSNIHDQEKFFSSDDYFSPRNTSHSSESSHGKNKTSSTSHSYSSVKYLNKNQSSTYNSSSNLLNRISIKRERSSSVERDKSSGYTRNRSGSRDYKKRYDNKRQRSDSRERQGSYNWKRFKSDSRDKDRKAYFRQSRIRSRSRDRESSTSSDRGRKSLSPKPRMGLFKDTGDNRFDFYRSSSPTLNTNRTSKERDSRERQSRTTGHGDVDDTDITLSKAMSSLLKKIIFDDKVQDNSKEGRMADMVLDMVKARLSGEQTNSLNSSLEDTRLTGLSEHVPCDTFSSDTQRSSPSTSFNTQSSAVYSVDNRNRAGHRSYTSSSLYNNVSQDTGNDNSTSNRGRYNSYEKVRQNSTFKARPWSTTTSRPWSTTSRRGLNSTRPFSSSMTSFHTKSTRKNTSYNGLSRERPKYSSKEGHSKRGHRSSSK